MAKRQNFVVGSTNPTTVSKTTAQLNTGWNKYEVLKAGDLDGVFNAVSDYSNDSSNEIANAIQSITGSQPTGETQTELAGALNQLRQNIETSSLTFKGYIATSAPSSSTYALVEGNIWINSGTLPTSFPIAASSIKEWNGTAWVNYSSTYTPTDFDFFRNINDNEGYYWFGGQWTVMSTDMATEYFTLNQVSGKWEIKSSVNLPGNPTTTTASSDDNSTKIATTAWVRNYAQPAGTLYEPDLFDTKWRDATTSNTKWALSDNNWKTNANAYNHLVDDINNSTLYGWSASASSSSTDPTVACAFSTNSTLAPGDKLYFFPADSNRTSYNDITQATIKTIYASDVGLETGNFFLSNSRLYYKSLSSIEYVRRSVVDITTVSETISGITVQYYLAADGHKICPASEESNVAAIYAATGVAWYYILDTVNQRFKLPRTQYNEVGLRDTVGKYVPESLPNITATISGTVSSGSSSGAAQDGSSYAGNWNYGTGGLKYVDIDASGSSSAYQNDAPVQQRATQMYLYFYVG